jgi:hypothetical protein
VVRTHTPLTPSHNHNKHAIRDVEKPWAVDNLTISTSLLSLIYGSSMEFLVTSFQISYPKAGDGHEPILWQHGDAPSERRLFTEEQKG